jgi:hypothetical protein
MDILTPALSQCPLHDKMRGQTSKSLQLDRLIDLSESFRETNCSSELFYCLLFVSGTLKSVSSNYGVKCDIAENYLQLFGIIHLNAVEQGICSHSWKLRVTLIGPYPEQVSAICGKKFSLSTSSSK